MAAGRAMVTLLAWVGSVNLVGVLEVAKPQTSEPTAPKAATVAVAAVAVADAIQLVAVVLAVPTFPRPTTAPATFPASRSVAVQRQAAGEEAAAVQEISTAPKEAQEVRVPAWEELEARMTARPWIQRPDKMVPMATVVEESSQYLAATYWLPVRSAPTVGPAVEVVLVVTGLPLAAVRPRVLQVVVVAAAVLMELRVGPSSCGETTSRWAQTWSQPSVALVEMAVREGWVTAAWVAPLLATVVTAVLGPMEPLG